MLHSFALLPTTPESKPFASAVEACGLEKLGYVEEEFLQTGTANLYREDARHQVEPFYCGAPYCTRVLLRRPSEPEKWSGNVVVEVLNSSANIDIDRMWVNSWPFFTRNGDIYVGISSKGQVVDVLKRFDPERYAPICWDNPLPERVPAYNPPAGPGHILLQYEVGLFWDMLLDLARLLRSDRPENPLRGLSRPYLYLTGWSQSTGYVVRYVSSFAYRRENLTAGPLFDGYLNGGGGVWYAALDNLQKVSMGDPGLQPGGVFGAREPFIAVNTEMENRIAFWYGDFDEPDFKLRTWQISGSSHNSKYNLLDYYGPEGVRELEEKYGIYNGYYGVDGGPLDAPHELVFNAAWYALYRWAREGVPAPHAPKIETEIRDRPSDPRSGSFVWNRTDAFGNCLGGIRTPAIQYPTARYYHTSHRADGSANPSFGTANPFSPDLLRELYGSLAHYATLISQEYDRLSAQGFLLPEDKPQFLADTLALAARRGLR